MPELLLELFSEEIPARMQAGAAAALARLVGEALAPLDPSGMQTFHGPRRIALGATVAGAVEPRETVARGPKEGVEVRALAGFMKKHGVTEAGLTIENGYYVVRTAAPAVPAATLVAQAMPGLLRRFPWPKSMRWGTGSLFTWVRPLRRVICLLDGAVVPFALAEGPDDGHGLVAGNETEGHRFHAPGSFAVHGMAGWRAALLNRHVVPEAAERRRLVAEGVERLAAAEGLRVVPDDGLLDEVAGLVEWPVPLLGRIDDRFMDLPPEVMQVSMRVNQRYFALRTADGAAAPRFAFVANVDATDGGAAIVAGNERVLRARFSDARHFWDLDRRTRLADRAAALEGITFHAKLGTQAARVRRIDALARRIAPLVGADPALAGRAALLAKADLTTGMVGEFPELQGVMGGYYAAHDGEDEAVAQAVREHYAPRGPNDPVPTAAVAVAVALADKIDQMAAFFAVDEAPSGSGDPYALRRAALGVIRIIRENGVRLHLATCSPGWRAARGGAGAGVDGVHRRPAAGAAAGRREAARRAFGGVRGRGRRRPGAAAGADRRGDGVPGQRRGAGPAGGGAAGGEHRADRGQEGRAAPGGRGPCPAAGTRGACVGRGAGAGGAGDPGRAGGGARCGCHVGVGGVAPHFR